MKEEIYYFHGTTTDGYRFTVAGEFITELLLNLSISVCSKSDRFEKVIGRNYASQRLGAGPHIMTKSYPATYLPGEPRKIFLNAAAKCCRMSQRKLLTKFGFQ